MNNKNDKAIWKYAFDSKGFLLIPNVATPVHFGIDPDGRMAIWCEIPIDHAIQISEHGIVYEVDRYIIAGTGQSVAHDAEHIGTLLDTPFVWHAYRVRNPKGSK